ncbi:MAG: undecaprenyl/decaprenyl-phosphate alpha-N-acetylglucosaminyl 1-phosphate transferase, partial [Bdellovibrionales bacterium]|nr:undecaprenyl/decaprenyl-phosphate alpha-N-acetylglucosaminyl 1-phosphate transferase [Bdellovibrionales bacterium]
MFFTESAAYKYILIFLSCYLLSWGLTPIIRKWAIAFGAVDVPGERRMHAQPTPRCGGVAIFLAVHCCALFVFVPQNPFGWDGQANLLDYHWWLLFLGSSSLLLLIGLYDDLRGLRAGWKLFGQIVTAAIMYFGGVRFGGVFGVPLSPVLDVLATILWHVAIINAFNLIDGHDGVATGLGAIAALGIGGTFVYRNLPLEALLLCGFIGACLGFLRYNYPPASIFLGDSGSMFLGFFLASITLSTSSKGTGLAALWVPLFALGIPIFDTALAIVRRSGRTLLEAMEG